MKFFTVALPLFAVIFAPSVLANNHVSCTCHNGDSYNWRITTLACENYAKAGYANSNVAYDTPSGRCTQASSSDYLMGDQWEEACKAIAKSGFQCADGKGTCFAETDQVRGSC
ncbi:hypothetical protein GQ53DRAFT_837298 [Thozetella sp. PMI_491]|nr:hypothetical protein GQ53DRAFT_837298 [Thozetella sp. PMI_491]